MNNNFESNTFDKPNNSLDFEGLIDTHIPNESEQAFDEYVPDEHQPQFKSYNFSNALLQLIAYGPQDMMPI